MDRIRLTRVRCEAHNGLEIIEGVVLDGVPTGEWGDGQWDFEGKFTVLEDDGVKTRVFGWNVETEVIED